jgi:hypothetical protein
MPARRKAAGFVECLAKRSLAYLKGTAQGRNMERLVYMCESQSLRLFDKIAERVALLSERRFLDGCEPLIDIHRNPPNLTAQWDGSTRPQHTTERLGAILSFGANWRFRTLWRGAQMTMVKRKEALPYEAPFAWEAGDGVSSPTRSAMETASASDEAGD